MGRGRNRIPLSPTETTPGKPESTQTYKSMNTFPQTAADQKAPAIFLLDAIATGGMALGLLFFAEMLSPLLGLPTGLLRWVSYILIPFAAIVAGMSLRPRYSQALAWVIVGINVLWTVDSLVLLATRWFQPTTLGITFILGQAAIVGAFAALQYRSLAK